MAVHAFVLAFALCAWFATGPGVAHAQREHARVGTSASGLRGLSQTGLPVPEPELNLAASAGYGLTESLEPVEGSHSRAQGSFAAAVAPLPWLALALRLDGRYDVHPDDGLGSHGGGQGDPHLYARAGRALSPEISLGGELGLWIPGKDAPSFQLAATTVDARALFAFTPEHSPWALLSALGVRLDQSAESAPDLERLRLGSRAALGLSSSHALLAAIGVARRLGDEVELYGELSGDLLIGGDAPPLLQSPLRAALGGRYFWSRTLQAELVAIFSLSERPELAPSDPLVPIEPRFALVAALAYRFGLGEPDEAPVRRGGAVITGKPAQAPAPQLASVAGALTDDAGAPLPDTKVTLRVGDEVRETLTDAGGRYAFANVPVGPATLIAEATGFEILTWQIVVQPSAPATSPRALAPKAEAGLLRGLVRSFDSTPLRAQIEVRPDAGRAQRSESADDGHFELELPAGAYRITISAEGFREQSRNVKITGNGVTILNVDLRERK